MLAAGQTISGSNLSSRSSGSGTGNWTLNENGYVGTYFSLATPGSVTLTVNASGATSRCRRSPHEYCRRRHKHGVRRGDRIHKLFAHVRPAGRYLFYSHRIQQRCTTANRQLTIGNLTVAGATVSNTTTTTTNDANALAAADTYIANYRRGPASVALSGLARHAGTAQNGSQRIQFRHVCARI